MKEQKRRIPTLIAFGILLLGIIGGIVFAESSLRYVTSGKKEGLAKDIRITNLTSSMATVSWVTDEKSVGTVYYNESGKKINKNLVALDDRGKKQNNKFTTHHVTLRELKPATSYSFTINDNKGKYNKEEKKYNFTTYKAYKLGKLGPASGKVKYKDNKSAAGSLIYLQIEGAEPLSTIVAQSGNWVIPLNIAYDKSKNLPIDENIKVINIFVRAPDGRQAQAVTTTKNDSPVPEIVMGKQYDFRGKKSQVLGKQSFEVKILQPAEKQALTSNRPLIRGKGIPGKSITIILKSKPQTAIVKVDKRGNWYWTPSNKLMFGEHTLTIQTFNKDGKAITLKRTFLVLKSGSKVLGEATPSATIVPPTPTIAFPTPVFDTPTPVATVTPPVSGNMLPVAIFITLGSLLVLLGVRPFFIKQI
jgi:hypothetical protein